MLRHNPFSVPDLAEVNTNEHIAQPVIKEVDFKLSLSFIRGDRNRMVGMEGIRGDRPSLRIKLRGVLRSDIADTGFDEEQEARRAIDNRPRRNFLWFIIKTFLLGSFYR